MTAKKPPVHRPDCGTPAGWGTHQRHGEQPCLDCTAAKTAYNHEWRHRTGRVKSRRLTTDELAQIVREAKAAALIDAARIYIEAHPMRYLDPAVDFMQEQAQNILMERTA